MSTEHTPINVLLRGEQSAEQIAVMDNTVSTGFPGPPLHHHDFDETFYVLEGELTFQLEDELFTRKAGELAFAPRGVPHTFANLSGAEARTPMTIEQHHVAVPSGRSSRSGRSA